MNHPIKHVEFVRKYLDGVFAEDVHAKRVMSLAGGAVGVMTGASLAVSIIGQSLAQARGLLSKHAIKQVDRLLSNQGIVVWDMFAPWVAEVVGARKTIVVAMDWTEFDADDQALLETLNRSVEGNTTRPCGQTGPGARAVGMAWAVQQRPGHGGDELLV